jgi:hypothetical protein
MFPLGHLGIGVRLVPARVRDRLHFGWLAFGCLLPDVLDKPVFFAAAKLARRGVPERFDVLLDALHGSRLFGHSVFFFAALAVAAALTRAEWLRAVAWGVATHLVLDLVPDLLSGARLQWPSWLLWPVFGWGFPRWGQVSGAHLEAILYYAGELVGAPLIVLELTRRRRARLEPESPSDA